MTEFMNALSLTNFEVMYISLWVALSFFAVGAVVGRSIQSKIDEKKKRHGF